MDGRIGSVKVTPGVEVRSKVWLERAGKVVLSDWRAALLEAVGETGSLARAAERMNVPYRTAWYKVKEIEEQLGVRLLETHSGGSGGGQSSLTPEAREILRRFHRVCEGIKGTVTARFETELGGHIQ